MPPDEIPSTQKAATMTIERREFLKTTGKAITAGAAALALGGKILGANDRVRVAICGVRGRGTDHIKGFPRVPGTEIVALCDIDETILSQRIGDVEKMNLPKPKTYVDVRKLLEDKAIDAISIADAQSLALADGHLGLPGRQRRLRRKALLAQQVRRPATRRAPPKSTTASCSTAARAAPTPACSEAIEASAGRHHRRRLHGSRPVLQVARHHRPRAPKSPCPPASTTIFGSAPRPLKPSRAIAFTTTGTGFWDTGNGDFGNQGIHEIDIAALGTGRRFPDVGLRHGRPLHVRRRSGNAEHSKRDFHFDGTDGKRKMMEFEVRHWITNHEAEIGTGAYGASAVPPAGLTGASDATKKPADKKSASSQQSLGPKDAKTNTVGNIFYGSNGYLAIDGYDAYKTWVTDEVEPGPHGKASGDHYANFIDCVRSRRAEDIHSPIVEAHISTTLVHLANASYRLGRTLKFDASTEQVIGDDEANTLLRGTYRAPYVVTENM